MHKQILFRFNNHYWFFFLQQYCSFLNIKVETQEEFIIISCIIFIVFFIFYFYVIAYNTSSKTYIKLCLICKIYFLSTYLKIEIIQKYSQHLNVFCFDAWPCQRHCWRLSYSQETRTCTASLPCEIWDESSNSPAESTPLSSLQTNKNTGMQFWYNSYLNGVRCFIKHFYWILKYIKVLYMTGYVNIPKI